MSRWKRTHRRDTHEGEIVAALRAVGATVTRIDDADPAGCPDLLIGFRGETYLAEVKRPEGKRGGTSKDGQHLGDDQVTWHAAWRGKPPVVVRTVDDALRAIGAIE